jgi:hypothetical protein
VHSIPIVALTRGFPLAPFGWFGTRRPFPWLKGPSCDPEVRHGGQCRPTMFKKQVSRPVDSLDPPSWPPRLRGSSEPEERPGHPPDPRFYRPLVSKPGKPTDNWASLLMDGSRAPPMKSGGRNSGRD